MESEASEPPAARPYKVDAAAMRGWALALSALCCAVYDAANHRPDAQALGLLCGAAGLLLIARALPITAPRERPLTLLAPLAFALTRWIGAGPAGMGAALACFLYARLGTPQGNAPAWTPGRERLSGAQFLIACCAASWVMRGLGLYPVTTLAPPSIVPLPARLAAVGLGGLTFALTLAGSYAFLYLPSWERDGRPANVRLHLLRLGAVMALGLLPVALLSSFESTRAAYLGVSALVLAMLAARLLRLHDEAAILREQLRASEEMGWASVHAPEYPPPEALVQLFLELSDRLVPSERSLLWEYDRETRLLKPFVARPDMGPFAGLTVAYEQGVIGRAAAQRRPRLVMDAAKVSSGLARQNEDAEPERITGAWLLFPIVMRDQLLGVAQWTRPAARPFAPSDIARLESLVPQAAIALESVYIRTQMLDSASLDGLTGLWNHRRMYELLREEMRRATRYHRALCILMMDVDSFKTFNDTHGHPRGDDLLRVVASVLQNSVRNVDHVGRYGGEEFMVVLPETSKDAACSLAERIRAEIEANAFVVIGGQAIHRTLSIGVASYPEDALNPAELVEQADAALYRAKRGGKNRVHWA